MAFSSGLTQLPDGRIVVAYGSSNAESRALIITPQGLYELFSDDEISNMPMATKCLGSWSDWAPCGLLPDGSCGTQRAYIIVSLAARGGEECPYADGALENKPCEIGRCAKPSEDVCTVPWHAGVYEASACVDDGSGIHSTDCKMDCAEGMNGEASAICPDGGGAPFVLSGCYHPGCSVADQCFLPKNKKDVPPNFNIAGCKDGGEPADCVVSCNPGYQGEAQVACFGGQYKLLGCPEIDACQGDEDPCQAGGDKGSTCRDLAPPSDGYECSECSEDFEVVDDLCRMSVTCKFSADAEILNVYFNDKVVTNMVKGGDFKYWPDIKEITFPYLIGAMLGVSAYNAVGDCDSGSFYLFCRVDADHRNPWNNIITWTDVDTVVAYGSSADDAPPYWYTSGFDATTAFRNPCPSKAVSRWEGDSEHQIWMSGAYAYFRIGPVPVPVL